MKPFSEQSADPVLVLIGFCWRTWEARKSGRLAVGQPGKVADALQAGRQRMLQEAADELFGGERQQLLVFRVPIVFPAKRNSAVFQRDEALVGDGYAMGVTAQISDHLVRSAESGQIVWC
jgi:hypothetical protein